MKNDAVEGDCDVLDIIYSLRKIVSRNAAIAMSNVNGLSIEGTNCDEIAIIRGSYPDLWRGAQAP